MAMDLSYERQVALPGKDYPLLYTYFNKTTNKIFALNFYYAKRSKPLSIGIQVECLGGDLIVTLRGGGATAWERASSTKFAIFFLDAPTPKENGYLSCFIRMLSAARKMSGVEPVSLMISIQEQSEYVFAKYFPVYPTLSETEDHIKERLRGEYEEFGPLSLQIIAPEMNRLLDTAFANMKKGI